MDKAAKSGEWLWIFAVLWLPFLAAASVSPAGEGLPLLAAGQSEALGQPPGMAKEAASLLQVQLL